jgi:hypothetical protein
MPVIGATQLEPVNILGSYVQGMELGRANRLAQQQQAAQMEAARQEAELRNYLSSADLSSPEVQNQLLRFGPQGAEMAKNLATMGTQRSQADKANYEAQSQRLKDMYNLVTSAVDPPSYARVRGIAANMGLDVSQIPEQYDPVFVEQAKNSVLTAAERLDAEARARTASIQERQAKVAEREVGLREEELRDKRAAAKTGVREDEDVVARTETAADGTVRMYNKYGKLLKAEAGAGKPSATFEKTRAAQQEMQRNLKETTSSLREIVKDNGLIDQSTGSGFGRGVDFAARFAGKATKGDIALGKLAIIADQVLKLVPRFEGPQSDKDTQTYREAAGQLADGTLPNEIRKEAAKTIIELYERRSNQFAIQGADVSGDGGTWQDL